MLLFEITKKQKASVRAYIERAQRARNGVKTYNAALYLKRDRAGVFLVCVASANGIPSHAVAVHLPRAYGDTHLSWCRAPMTMIEHRATTTVTIYNPTNATSEVQTSRGIMRMPLALEPVPDNPTTPLEYFLLPLLETAPLMVETTTTPILWETWMYHVGKMANAYDAVALTNSGVCITTDHIIGTRLVQTPITGGLYTNSALVIPEQTPLRVYTHHNITWAWHTINKLSIGLGIIHMPDHPLRHNHHIQQVQRVIPKLERERQRAPFTVIPYAALTTITHLKLPSTIITVSANENVVTIGDEYGQPIHNLELDTTGGEPDEDEPRSARVHRGVFDVMYKQGDAMWYTIHWPRRGPQHEGCPLFFATPSLWLASVVD